MIPAPSVETMQKRFANLDQEWRVMSLLFATPSSPVMQDLENKIGRLDALTGNRWDLFFPGYWRYAPANYYGEDEVDTIDLEGKVSHGT